MEQIREKSREVHGEGQLIYFLEIKKQHTGRYGSIRPISLKYGTRFEFLLNRCSYAFCHKKRIVVSLYMNVYLCLHTLVYVLRAYICVNNTHINLCDNVSISV